jgi:hypothetical protein
MVSNSEAVTGFAETTSMLEVLSEVVAVDVVDDLHPNKLITISMETMSLFILIEVRV